MIVRIVQIQEYVQFKIKSDSKTVYSYEVDANYCAFCLLTQLIFGLTLVEVKNKKQILKQ